MLFHSRMAINKCFAVVAQLDNLHRKLRKSSIQASELRDIIISSSVNHPSRTLAAHQTPKVRVLNLPLTSQAVTRVSGSSRPCHNRAASCLLTGGRGKQHIDKQLSDHSEISLRGVSLSVC